MKCVQPTNLPHHIPLRAKQAFETVEKNWSGDVPLAELLDRVNQVAAHFLHAGNRRDSRTSLLFSPRSLRHYQTLGCIDAPERLGKQVVYGFRHFVQALLVRGLLRDRMSSERIVTLMAGRSNEEMKCLLFEGVEIGARRISGEIVPSRMGSTVACGLWTRITILTGIELHVSRDVPKFKPAELKQIIASLEAALRRNL